MQVSGAPIYAYSPYGLANRLLGLASAMHVCAMLRRPMSLIWKENASIGYAKFDTLFDNRIEVIPRKPECMPVVHGEHPQTAESFPEDVPIILECHDVCKYPGLDARALRLGLGTLQLAPSISSRLNCYLESHNIAGAVGVHIREGDKLKGIKNREVRKAIGRRYAAAIAEIISRTEALIYLSCDNPGTWDWFKAMHGERIEGFPRTRNPLQRDAGSVAEAVLELYLLSMTRWMLYGVGTFGYAAHVLGGNAARNVFYGKDEFFLFFDKRRGLPTGSLPAVPSLVGDLIAMTGGAVTD